MRHERALNLNYTVGGDNPSGKSRYDFCGLPFMGSEWSIRGNSNTQQTDTVSVWPRPQTSHSKDTGSWHSV